jgi:tetratricopeptide (TPR) repeat protein
VSSPELAAPRPPTSFRVTSDPAVQITIYDATRTLRGQAEGSLRLLLLPGLYRVHLERGGRVHHEIVDHDTGTDLRHAGPALHSPVPFAGAATSHDDHIAAAERCSVLDTAPPLGPGPHDSRVFVFVRRAARDGEPRSLPGEPVTLHDADGRELTAITGDNAEIDHTAGYVAYACRATPGTYRLRAARSQRDAAIVVPAGRAAQVFVTDTGSLRLAELRLALVPVDARFDPTSLIWGAMEGVIAALRAPDRPLPLAARAMLPDAIDGDLCFGIAAAHVLWRSRDRAGLAAVMRHLARYRAIPDVAILDRLEVGPAEADAPLHRSPAGLPDTPPLLRASLHLAMTRPELDPGTLSAYSAFAHAARTAVHDSVWCLWSMRTWDERWIEPAVERLRDPDHRRDASAIARSLALATETVEQAIEAIEVTAPSVHGQPLDVRGLAIPGYTLDPLLGRGARSAVYRARRRADGQAIALKIVPVPGGADGCARALRTLERGPSADHPGLLAATARGTLPGGTGIWLEMERCDHLIDRLSEHDAPLAPREAHRWVLDALAVLAHLHERGIAHGDLELANLLLRRDGSVAIASPGLAVRRALPDLRHATDAPRLAPPELLRGEPPAPASDVWAMAAIHYFLLTLEYPRDEYADQSPLEAALNNPIVSLARRRPDLPAALVQCIDGALSHVREARPRDAGAFRRQLAAIDAVALPAQRAEDAPGHREDGRATRSGSAVATAPVRRSAPPPGATRIPNRGKVGSLRAAVRGRVAIGVAAAAAVILGVLVGSITRSSSDSCDRARSQLRQAMSLTEAGSEELAMASLATAETANRTCRDRAMADSVALNQAWLLRQRDPAGAGARLDTVARSSGERPESLLLRSYLAADRGDLADAERQLERAEQLAPDARWTWRIAQAHAELAELRGGEGDERIAEQNYRKAITAIAALRSTAHSPAASLVSRHRGPDDGLIALLARQARWDAVLSVVLQLDATAPQADLDSQNVASAWQARDLVIAIAPSRRQIGPGRERAYRIRIANGEVRGEDIGDAARAAQLAAALFTNPADREAARALGAMIVPTGPETSTLHVLAIGALGRAPLAALRDATGSLIIARRPLTRVLALQASRPDPATTRHSVVIGDPLGNLPGAAAEGAVVARAVGPDVAFAGARARVEATRSLLWSARDAELLHVAAPILALGPSRTLRLSDGTVEPGEIVQRGVAPRIAVLTGNSSATMDEDGQGSFASALLAAGTQIVIATDRSVEDAAALSVMREFYAQPDWQADPERALARVQVALEARGASGGGASRAGAWSGFCVLRRPPNAAPR